MTTLAEIPPTIGMTRMAVMFGMFGMSGIAGPAGMIEERLGRIEWLEQNGWKN